MRMRIARVKHLTTSELEAGLDDVHRSPKDRGVLEMIVRRPQVGEREILDEGQLDLADGLVGDSWKMRSSRRTADGTPHPDMQLNLMNSRVVALVAQDRSRWHLAGDQLLRRPRSERRQPAARHAAGDRIGGDRGHRRAAHRLLEVRRALRRSTR